MMSLIVVTVLLAGRPIPSSEPACLRGGTVMAPLIPIVSVIADSIDLGDRTIVVRSADRSIRLIRNVQTVTAQDGSVYVPLARVVAALGGSVRYDGLRRVAIVDMPLQRPISTPTPFDPSNPSVAPSAVFTPQPSGAPRPAASGIPRPRRTPVPAVPSNSGS